MICLDKKCVILFAQSACFYIYFRLFRIYFKYFLVYSSSFISKTNCLLGDSFPDFVYLRLCSGDGGFIFDRSPVFLAILLTISP